MKTKIMTLIMVMFFALMFCSVVSAADAQNVNDLVYSTYLGGSSTESVGATALDSKGNIYITGSTSSGNFNVTTGKTLNGTSDAFLTKFSSNGTLIYSTYIGGSGTEGGSGIAVDNQDNIYVTGTTTSMDFPTTDGTYKSNIAGNGDIFACKFNSYGTLIYSTLLGGSGTEGGSKIAVDSNGNVYITGQTKSTDFPTTVGAYQTSLQGGADTFLAKLNPNGSELLYSTYFGGSSSVATGAKIESAAGIVVDNQGNAWITGTTNSEDFPTTTGAYKTKITSDGNDIYWADTFISKIAPNGNGNNDLIYSTLLGGNTADDIPYGIKLDSQGNIYVAGKTASADFPTTSNAYQKTIGWPDYSDGFVSKIAPNGNGNNDLVYSTYLGATVVSHEYIYALAVDSQGNIYVAGQTTSTKFPVTTNAYQTTRKGTSGTDAFLTKFNFNGALVYSTYFGGTTGEEARAIAVDDQGNVWIAGVTTSTNLPLDGTYPPYKAKKEGPAISNDAFVAKFITAPTVTASPSGGLFNTTQSVTLITIHDSATTTYYTTDGSDPRSSSTRKEYTGAIPINSTTILKFAAVDALDNWSPIYAETYVIDTTAPVPKADLPSDSYNTTQTVKLSATDNVDSNPKIYYTLDGTNPTTSSKLYDGPITIANTTTLKFIAVDEAGNKSPVYSETYKIKSNVYVNITSSKTNPQVGDKVTYTFKLGNSGPGTAKDVIFTYVIPEGLEFAGAKVDQGTWTYNKTTRTLTWNLGDVKVGDPYLWLDLNILSRGIFNIQPLVSVSGYNPGLEANIGSMPVNAASASNAVTVNAATKTIPMQDTGIPLTGLTMALLLVGSGLALARRK